VVDFLYRRPTYAPSMQWAAVRAAPVVRMEAPQLCDHDPPSLSWDSCHGNSPGAASTPPRM